MTDTQLIIKELEKINNRLSNLETGQNQIINRLESLEANVSQLQTDVATIKATTNRIEDVLRSHVRQALEDNQYFAQRIFRTEDKTAKIEQAIKITV